VVVSKPVIATVAEGHYDLHLPWRQDLFDTRTPAPTWSVVRIDNGSRRVNVSFSVPLVRFVDGMPVGTRPIWLKADAIPEVFTLPDAGARYEVRVVVT